MSTVWPNPSLKRSANVRFHDLTCTFLGDFPCHCHSFQLFLH